MVFTMQVLFCQILNTTYKNMKLFGKSLTIV
jgi:hypothetical protein